jgi:group II intron reverse transcriptase/maturase
MTTNKPYDISKNVVLEAYKRVKANKGCAGIDDESIEEFEKDLKNNLYRIWNRMSSGSYFPPAVKAVDIPKKAGGKRTLGIPTVGDRVAQMVVKMYLEPRLEAIFLPESYGYRPGKSALGAVGQARQECWARDYVVEFDIKGLFDNINHELLMKAVDKHVEEGWIKLYISRWLKAPFVAESGKLIDRNSGTPQGGVISPLLANLFMHYAFDVWMKRTFPGCPFERYADDAVIHCRSEQGAQGLLKRLDQRMRECKLELHPEKTRIIYCKDSNRNRTHLNTSFDFLGYNFRGRMTRTKSGKFRVGFVPAVSRKSQKAFRDKVKALRIHRQVGVDIESIAKELNPIVGGWLNYFSAFYKSEVAYSMACLNKRLYKWVRRKFGGNRMSKTEAWKWLMAEARKNLGLFAHWKVGWLP